MLVCNTFQHIGKLVSDVDQSFEILIKDKKYVDALTLCHSALADNPEDFSLHNKLISIYRKLSEFDKAVEASNSFVSYFPQHPVPYFSRCRCYLSLQQYDLADADCEKILQLGDEMNNDYYKEIVLLFRAYIAYKGTRFELAESYLEEVETDCSVVAGEAMFNKEALLKKIASIRNKTKSGE